MNVLKRHCQHIVICCLLLAAWTGVAAGATLEPGEVAVCVESGCALREYLSPGNVGPKVLDMLEPGEWVRVERQEGAWTRVLRPDGMRGFVNSKSLVPVDAYIAAQPNPEDFTCAKEMPHRFEVLLGPETGRGSIVLEDIPDLYGGSARIRVLSESGKTLWLGPIDDAYGLEPLPSPLAFYCQHDGVSWPELIGELSGDGYAEIIAPVGQSDVSVSAFNRLRWNGSAFVPLFTGMSLVESPKGSGNYVFRKYAGDSQNVRWVMSFNAWRGQGLAEAAIYEYAATGKIGETELRTGTGLLELTPEGARLKSWIEPLQVSPQ